MCIFCEALFDAPLRNGRGTRVRNTNFNRKEHDGGDVAPPLFRARLVVDHGGSWIIDNPPLSSLSQP